MERCQIEQFAHAVVPLTCAELLKVTGGELADVAGRSLPPAWSELRDRRMTEPGADAAYDAARLAFELGAGVRELRLARAWSQADLAAVGMTQSAVARFEAGGTVPTLSLLARIAAALDADLTVRVGPRPYVAGPSSWRRSRKGVRSLLRVKPPRLPDGLPC